jgi:hypothetical protein
MVPDQTDIETRGKKHAWVGPTGQRFVAKRQNKVIGTVNRFLEIARMVEIEPGGARDIDQTDAQIWPVNVRI